MSKGKKIYVVWDGIEPGIYYNWDDCKKQVHNYPQAKYKSFSSESEAKEAFLSSYWDVINKQPAINKPTAEQLKKYGMPNFESISVDAACSGNPGIMEYRGVNTKTGIELFRQGPFKNGTNNIGEFLALVHGLAILKQQNSDLPIYSDSITAIAWVKAKKAKSKLKPSESNVQLFDLIARAETWLAQNDYTSVILKWETAVWGEIPADFGRK